MTGTFDISAADMNAFQDQVKRYARETGKPAAYVVNRTALNVAIKTGMNTPIANVEHIRAVADNDWWPKKVAKRLSSGSEVKLKGKLPKKYGGRRNITGKYTREEAQRASKQMIKNRVAKKGYIRSGWLPSLRLLNQAKRATRGKIKDTPRFSRNPDKQPGSAIAAQPGVNPVAQIANSAEGVSPVGSKALQTGIILATFDMRQYIDEEYGEHARAAGAT